MLAAMASFIGRFALNQVIRNYLAEQGEISELIQKVLEKLGVDAERRPRILGVESETWYGFRMADEGYWRHANRLLSDEMGSLVVRSYNNLVERVGVPPFALTASPSSEGILIAFRKGPRSEGFSRDQCFSATVDAVRQSMRSYVRAAASGVLTRE